MFKKILGGIAIVAIAVATALSVNVKSGDKGLTELGLANAKALADAAKLIPGQYNIDCNSCVTYGSSACWRGPGSGW